ncbi:glycoside hydrolase domain-containing protein [Streptomyces sp. TBY4]|uniref:glycoside hydrolase domain-containing protein n=1 Tax=Streptomyces sp. TBY4 TaxID=2962030 RepID=UPI0035B4013B
MSAAHKAEEHGFQPGSRTYFAVDYDAVNDEVTAHTLPYFRSVKNQMQRMGNPYQTGTDGPRNVRSRVAKEGYVEPAFIDAQLRIPLYDIFENCNRIIRGA